MLISEGKLLSGGAVEGSPVTGVCFLVQQTLLTEPLCFLDQTEQVTVGLSLSNLVAASDLIDLPQQGRGLDLDAQHRRDTPDPEQAEVGDRPGAGGAFGRRRRLDRFGGLEGFGHVRRSAFG